MAQGAAQGQGCWHLEGVFEERVGDGVGVGDGGEPRMVCHKSVRQEEVSMGKEGSVWGRGAEGRRRGQRWE